MAKQINHNLTIAEYMGWKTRECTEVWPNDLESPDIEYYNGCHVTYCCPNYESLDSLVPVWEKMDLRFEELQIWSRGNGEFEVMVGKFNQWNNYSIQEAACIATAKMIKEMTNGE